MIVLFIIIILVIATIFTKYLWSVIIPEIFPGLVEAGYIADEISFFVAFILVIFIGTPFIRK